MRRLKLHLNLSEEQEGQFRQLFEEVAAEMSRLPPASREHVEKIRSYRPRMEALLRPEQQAAFTNYLHETEERFERVIRRRAP